MEISSELLSSARTNAALSFVRVLKSCAADLPQSQVSRSCSSQTMKSSYLIHMEGAFVEAWSNQLLLRLWQVDTTIQVTVVLHKPWLINSEINFLQINYTLFNITIWCVLKF